MKAKSFGIIATICSCTLISGCATMGQSAGLATLGCAGVGILTGVLTKNAGAGAGAGAGCLAIAGVALYKYHQSQARSVQQDQQLYGYAAPVNSTEVKIRNVTASPEKLRAGEKLKVFMDYSVMAPTGTTNVEVKETMILKRDGEVIKTLFERPVQRPLGGGISEVEFNVPDKLPSGTYVIEQKVESGTSYDLRPTVFYIAS